MPLSMQTAGLEDAERIVSAAHKAALSTGVKATIVVVDRGGDVIVAHRMDGAWPGAFDLALAKAKASHGFTAPSGSFLPLVQPGQPLFGVGTVAAGKYLTLPGGHPIRAGEDVVGAVGVSGGSPGQDEQIALAAIAAFIAD